MGANVISPDELEKLIQTVPMMPLAEFELKLLRGDLPGLPSAQYEDHKIAVEFCLAIGLPVKRISELLNAALLRSNAEVETYDLMEAADGCPND